MTIYNISQAITNLHLETIMDFKLDLKLQNEVDLSVSKNEPVIVYTTHQTDSMFILIIDLKKGGYGRKDIKLEINEDGSRMTISGEMPTRKGFHKTFLIPEGVVLDKVKAKFDDDESRLTIRMPKMVQGMLTGVGIQELKDPAPYPGKEITSDQHEQNEEMKASTDNSKKQVKPERQVEEDDEAAKKVAEKSFTPIIVGSSLFVSLIVIFFSFIRSKNESSKKTK